MKNKEPIVLTATMAVWASIGGQIRVLDAIEEEDVIDAVNGLTFYGVPAREAFSDYIRMGEADITVRLFPKDKQTRLAVNALQAELQTERAESQQRQNAILEHISKLSALTFEAAS